MENGFTYNDRLFKWAAAAVGAYFVTEFGGEDGYFSLRRLLTRDFYIEYGSSLLIALVLVHFIAFVTRRLDQRCDWLEKPVLRIGLQTLLGVLLPALIDFFMASVYFAIFGVNIADTIYPRYAMPYIILMLVAFNLYYVIYYFYLRLTTAERTRKEELSGIFFPSNLQLLPLRESEGDEPTRQVSREEKLREAFIALRGNRTFSIPVEDIALIYRYRRQTFIYTLEETELIFQQTLEYAELALSPHQFFRVNRSMIINVKTIRFFEAAGNGRLKLFLKPQPPHRLVVQVSRKKVQRFKDWVDR